MGLEEQGRAAECCTEVGVAVLRKKITRETFL